MALTYNNYSNLLCYQKNYSESRRYVDSAISLARVNKDPYKEMMYLNNKGSLLSDMGQYDQAIDIYKNCVLVNKRHDWQDRLVKNYIGISEAYEKKGKYDSAYKYLNDFYWLKDSIAGIDVKLKIADLEAKNKSQQKDLDLKIKQFDLDQARSRMKKWMWAAAAGMILMIAIVVIWYIQNKQAKLENIKDKMSLADLTKLLLNKNTLLTDLEEKLLQNTEKRPFHNYNDFETNLYNQRILTDDDWASFKIYFEKVYPGYLFRLRSAYIKISEAEERLFLFIKLGLKNKESAAILGISVDGVKKTRTRLRRRLELNEDEQLDKFIHDF
ncbi:MAG: tetratricopeptide repeat protein [Ferruginibacter sp.]